MSTSPLDRLGKEFKVGDIVVRAIKSSRASNIYFSEVTRIENDKVYLDDSKVAMIYPVRLLIITDMLKDLKNWRDVR